MTAFELSFVRRRLLFIALITLALGPAQAQTDVAPIKTRLTEVIRAEMAQKHLPAVYLALVDGQSVVWSTAFGYADPSAHIPARFDDVLRIASVSKLFTDVAVMQLVEQGVLDLDAPVTKYLPDFHPNNPFGTPITLRQLMTHHSGLVREPPVGNYFDSTEPTLDRTVASLNSTTLVYRPGTRFKYSNAGLAVAGEIVERIRKQPFAISLNETVFQSLGLISSSFAPLPALLKREPKAVLWTYDGRALDVPTFQFGMAPAANMYSTLGDLTLFIRCLLNHGEGARGRVLTGRSLEEMWTPQFADPGRKTGIGLGFFVGSLDGHRSISHSGDVYGFATEVRALPDDQLGVVVVNTMNAANAWSTSIAEYALRLLLAHRLHEPLPERAATHEVDSDIIKTICGKYRGNQITVRFYSRPDGLYLEGQTIRAKVRQLGQMLMTDDKTAYGTPIRLLRDAVVLGADTLFRVPDDRPNPPPDEWNGLIGEYGWDYNILYIKERDGALCAHIEWYFSFPLTEISRDRFMFPDVGLYQGEQLSFRRNAKGQAIEAMVGGVVFPRRVVGPEDGSTFRIVRQRPVDQLRREALAASPPPESGEFRKPDLVELAKLDSTIRLDIRYATTNNFMNTVFYSEPRAFMQRPAAEAVVRASRWLHQLGFGLLVHDAYRPWYVTKMFWDATPASQRDFVANPADGSRHNRGCAVDITLYDLATGKPVPMVSGYDEFSTRAFPEYPGGTSIQRWDRELLRTALEAQGFKVYLYEWWHFDFAGWQHYPILNLTFDKISH